MKVTVTPRVVGGRTRGGEDLFLDFEATGEPSDTFTVEPVPGDPTGDPSWDCEGEGDEDDPTNIWSCDSPNYEFKWSGTLADLHKLAAEAGVTDLSEWEWCGKVVNSPERRFRHTYYVDGNAD